MKKALFIIIASVAVLGGLIAVLLLQPADSAAPVVESTQPTTQGQAVEPAETPATTTTPTTQNPANPPTSNMPQSAPLSQGRYIDYNSSVVAASGYNETILFFHANWCPECRAFEQAITEGSIADGVQIVKVDYDNSDDLRQKYGVTIQTTFVKVTSSGDRVSSWVGNGRDKSLAAILENT